MYQTLYKKAELQGSVIMKAKEYLLQIEKNRVEIELLDNQIETLLARTTSTTASQNDIVVQSSGNQQKMEDAIIKAVDLSAKLESKRAHLKETITDVIKTIDSIPSDTIEKIYCKQLLQMRYVDCIKWELIAVKMNFTFGYVTYKLHKRALNEVQKILNGRKE